MLFNLTELFRSLFAFVGLVKPKNGFPPPLSGREEAELIARLANGDADARDKLIEHNLRLVAHIAKKYARHGRDLDDLISIGTIGLIKAVGTFDACKARNASSYFARCAENEILMSLRSEKKRGGDVSLEDPIGADRDGNEITLADIIASDAESVDDEAIRKADSRSLRNAVSSALTPRERCVIILRYGLKDGVSLPQRAVAEKLNISRSYVSRIEKKALEKLNRCLTCGGD